MYIKVYTVIYLYVPMLRMYKYFNFVQCFPCLWISLDIPFDGHLYDLMVPYAMVQLSMGVWSRWW